MLRENAGISRNGMCLRRFHAQGEDPQGYGYILKWLDWGTGTFHRVLEQILFRGQAEVKPRETILTLKS